MVCRGKVNHPKRGRDSGAKILRIRWDAGQALSCTLTIAEWGQGKGRYLDMGSIGSHSFLPGEHASVSVEPSLGISVFLAGHIRLGRAGSGLRVES